MKMDTISLTKHPSQSSTWRSVTFFMPHVLKRPKPLTPWIHTYHLIFTLQSTFFSTLLLARLMDSPSISGAWSSAKTRREKLGNNSQVHCKPLVTYSATELCWQSFYSSLLNPAQSGCGCKHVRSRARIMPFGPRSDHCQRKRSQAVLLLRHYIAQHHLFTISDKDIT